MATYLVVADETATGDTLIDRLRDIARRDTDARFALVVPAAPVEHLLTVDETEGRRAAARVAEEAAAAYRAAGLRLERATVGDPSPVASVEEVLRADPACDAVVLSTRPPGKATWLALEAHAHMARDAGRPVIHVVEGAAEGDYGPPVPIPPPETAGQAVAAEAAPADASARAETRTPADAPATEGRRVPWPWIGALMAIYLGVIASLALGENRGYFVLGGVALAVFVVIGGGVWYFDHAAPPARPR